MFLTQIFISFFLVYWFTVKAFYKITKLDLDDLSGSWAYMWTTKRSKNKIIDKIIGLLHELIQCKFPCLETWIGFASSLPLCVYFDNYMYLLFGVMASSLKDIITHERN